VSLPVFKLFLFRFLYFCFSKITLWRSHIEILHWISNCIYFRKTRWPIGISFEAAVLGGTLLEFKCFDSNPPRIEKNSFRLKSYIKFHLGSCM
jgi:hypothetical protein